MACYGRSLRSLLPQANIFNVGVFAAQRDKNDITILDYKLLEHDVIDKKDMCRWIKPMLIYNSPLHEIFWIDCDAIVFKDPKKMPAFVFLEYYNPPLAKNRVELYNLLPINRHIDVNFVVNSGVMHLYRDEPLLFWWRYCVEQALYNYEIRGTICCWDQGALVWAIHKVGLGGDVSGDINWNFPANWPNHFSRFRYGRNYFMNQVKADHPDKAIVHWMGEYKYWEEWRV